MVNLKRYSFVLDHKTFVTLVFLEILGRSPVNEDIQADDYDGIVEKVQKLRHSDKSIEIAKDAIKSAKYMLPYKLMPKFEELEHRDDLKESEKVKYAFLLCLQREPTLEEQSKYMKKLHKGLDHVMNKLLATKEGKKCIDKVYDFLSHDKIMLFHNQVKKLYIQYKLRLPREEALEYWYDQLEKGHVTRDTIKDVIQQQEDSRLIREEYPFIE